MKQKKRLTKIALLALFCSTAFTSPAWSKEDIGSELPPDVRGLLIQEMVAILGATQNIINAMVRGEDQVVAQEAQSIHDSFILAQELTEEQEQALLNVASDEFLKKDEALHKMSAALAEAARDKDRPLQQEVFSEMLEACVACHTDHAAQRFPSLQNP